MSTILHPEGWPPAKGFAHGVAAEGRTIWVAGQWGSDQAGKFASGLAAQVEQALRNIAAVLATAGAGPEQIVRLTWYATDVVDYNAQLKEIGAAYRRVMDGISRPWRSSRSGAWSTRARWSRSRRQR